MGMTHFGAKALMSAYAHLRLDSASMQPYFDGIFSKASIQTGLDASFDVADVIESANPKAYLESAYSSGDGPNVSCLRLIAEPHPQGGWISPGGLTPLRLAFSTARENSQKGGR